MKTWMYTLAGLAILSPLSASPITVTIGFTGSGTLGGTPFTGASVLITAAGDTGSNTAGPAGVFFMHPTMTTIAIPGFSLATVTDSSIIADNQNFNVADFSIPGTDEAVLIQTAFGSYSLQTSLGPLSPSINTSNWSSVPVHTNQGNILVTGSSNATFQAIVSGAAVVPEPESLALLLAGLSAIAAGVLRTRRLNP